MAQRIGKRVGNYVVTELIGEGGMGAVYRADHPDIGRRVAVKLLDQHLGDHPEVCKRFLTEARAIARIEHPNVIDIFDFGRTLDGQLYYVMELLKGVELRQAMEQKGAMSPAEAQPYIEQICDGLQAAHDHDVVHRDLKPENIYVLEGNRLVLKIIDFGIARLDEPGFEGPARTAKGVVMGTPLTIAPEQASGEPDKIGPRTDIYSLGVIIYWMLAGRPPFQGEPAAVILARHITDEPPLLRSLASQVPQSLAALVHRCLAKDPAQRPGSALEIARAFEEVLGSPAVASSVSGVFASQGPPDIALAKTQPPEPQAPSPVTFDRPARLPAPLAASPPAPAEMPPVPEPAAPLASIPEPPPPLAPTPEPPPPLASTPEPEPPSAPTPEPEPPPPVSEPAPEPGPIQRVPSAEELLGALTGGVVEVDDEEEDDEPSAPWPEVPPEDPEPSGPWPEVPPEDDEPSTPWPEVPPDEPDSLEALAAGVVPESEGPEPEEPSSWQPPVDDLPPFSVDEGVVSVTPLPDVAGVAEEPLRRVWSRRTVIGGGLAVLAVVGIIVVVLLSSGRDVDDETAEKKKASTGPALELAPLPALQGSGDPDGPAAHLRAGEQQYAARDLSGAIREYRAALKAAPHHGHTLFRLAEAHQAQGQLQAAETGYRTALEADAALAAAVHHKLGDLHESQGRAAQAIAEYKAAIEADARYVPPLVALGFTYARLRRYDDAIQQLDRAVKLQPDRAVAHYFRGTVLFNLDRAEDAIASYELALELRPRYPEAHYYLGQVHLKQGDKAAARKQFEAALEDDPEYEPAVLALAKLK